MYQCWSSHQTGATRSVTDKGFFGNVLNLSSGDVSSSVGSAAVAGSTGTASDVGLWLVSGSRATRRRVVVVAVDKRAAGTLGAFEKAGFNLENSNWVTDGPWKRLRLGRCIVYVVVKLRGLDFAGFQSSECVFQKLFAFTVKVATVIRFVGGLSARLELDVHWQSGDGMQGGIP